MLALPKQAKTSCLLNTKNKEHSNLSTPKDFDFISNERHAKNASTTFKIKLDYEKKLSLLFFHQGLSTQDFSALRTFFSNLGLDFKKIPRKTWFSSVCKNSLDDKLSSRKFIKNKFYGDIIFLSRARDLTGAKNETNKVGDHRAYGIINKIYTQIVNYLILQNCLHVSSICNFTNDLPYGQKDQTCTTTGSIFINNYIKEEKNFKLKSKEPFISSTVFDNLLDTEVDAKTRLDLKKTSLGNHKKYVQPTIPWQILSNCTTTLDTTVQKSEIDGTNASTHANKKWIKENYIRLFFKVLSEQNLIFSGVSQSSTEIQEKKGTKLNGVTSIKIQNFNPQLYIDFCHYDDNTYRRGQKNTYNASSSQMQTKPYDLILKNSISSIEPFFFNIEGINLKFFSSL